MELGLIRDYKTYLEDLKSEKEREALRLQEKLSGVGNIIREQPEESSESEEDNYFTDQGYLKLLDDLQEKGSITLTI